MNDSMKSVNMVTDMCLNDIRRCMWTVKIMKNGRTALFFDIFFYHSAGSKSIFCNDTQFMTNLKVE